jgi:hypothetical protein
LNCTENECGKLFPSSVIAVTVRPAWIGDTLDVNMVRRARKNALLEPGDAEQLWTGEAAANFV